MKTALEPISLSESEERITCLVGDEIPEGNRAMNYDDFIDAKTKQANACGFDAQEIAAPLFDWQKHVVKWACRQGRVLNREGARDDRDERHICPLQLDVIERAVNLWTNPGDLVYSPFAGIGSEGYGALNLGRKFVGSELKESYFNQACCNLKNTKSQMSIF